jgi:hypothetical protein
MIALDPARDTPAQLAAFASGAGLDPARWTLLTGTDDDVLTLAAALDVRYRPGAGGEIDHANVLTVLDADGRIAHQQLGLGGDAAATRAAVERLLRCPCRATRAARGGAPPVLPSRRDGTRHAAPDIHSDIRPCPTARFPPPTSASTAPPP